MCRWSVPLTSAVFKDQVLIQNTQKKKLKQNTKFYQSPTIVPSSFIFLDDTFNVLQVASFWKAAYGYHLHQENNTQVMKRMDWENKTNF